jgi:HD-GYP domain-containing protein (c-di-GMP phosphodiesterase class II)
LIRKTYSTIIDVFDALTAGDRPYKPAMTVERAFAVLDDMVANGQIDSHILSLFKKSEAWKE